MQVIIQILTDDGKVVVDQTWDALTPQTVRLKEPVKVPCLVNGAVAGEYTFWAFSYQPQAKLSGRIGGY
jgi:hypothetical protein